MNGRSRVIGGIVLLVGFVLALAAVGALAYNAGIAQSATAALPAGEAGSLAPHYYGPFGYPGFRPVSLLLICLVLPFMFFLFFGAMKFVFAPWGMERRRHGWGWKGGEERRRHFEEMAAEWHRKAHEEEANRTEDDKV
jgi:hypothetical protein